MDKCLKVYGLIEGPINTYDIPDWDEKHGWVVLCQVEQINGAIEEEDIIFDTFDEAYEIVRWFKSQIAPYELWDHV